MLAPSSRDFKHTGATALQCRHRSPGGFDGHQALRRQVRHARRSGTRIKSAQGQPPGGPSSAQTRRLAAAAVRRRWSRRQERARPALSCSVRSGRLHRLGSRAHRLATVRGQRARARRAPDPRPQDGTYNPRVSRLLHRAGRQPVRQFLGDRQLRGLPDTRAHPLRRPRVPHTRVARSPRLLRQVVGRIWRDHSRHEIRSALGRHRRSLRRFVLRLRLLARLAQYAQRAH